MKTAYITGSIALAISIACFIAYQTSPNYIAEDGTLVESFGYIPLAILFGTIGLFGIIAGSVMQYRSRK